MLLNNFVIHNIFIFDNLKFHAGLKHEKKKRWPLQTLNWVARDLVHTGKADDSQKITVCTIPLETARLM